MTSALAAAEPSTSPSTVPATQPATSPATGAATEPTTAPTSQTAVDPAALPLLTRLAAAYAADRPLQIAGELTGDFDVAGRQKHSSLHVTGQTDGRGHFLHRGDGAGLIVSDGADAYVYDQVQNAYARISAFPDRMAAADVDASVVNILLDENPALLLAIVDDPAALLRRASEQPITLERAGPVSAPATGPGGVGLVLKRSDKSIVLRVDPATGELLGSVIDYTQVLAERHTNGVKVARAVLVYEAAEHATLPGNSFAWHPPVTATEFALQAELIKHRPATQAASQPVTPPATQP